MNAKILLMPIAIVMLMTMCKQPGVSVSVNGRTIGEAEVEKEMPEAYKRLRGEYNSQVRELLEQLAVKRMMELAAKENNTTPEEYSRSLMNAAEPPTEREIIEFYDQIRKSGQTEGASLQELHDRIAQHLRETKGREAVGKQLAVLKKKYNYSFDVTRVKVETSGQPERGSPQAKVTIVEFSDFECPFCVRVQPTTQKVREKYGDKVRWVFKDFPLNFHPHAMAMHVGARCVFRINPSKYWNFFDIIFDPKRPADALTPEGVEKMAVQVGTDTGKYRECLKDASIEKEIRSNMKEGETLGVNGTPAFFINGRMLSGAQPFEAFESVIDEEL